MFFYYEIYSVVKLENHKLYDAAIMDGHYLGRIDEKVAPIYNENSFLTCFNLLQAIHMLSESR